MANKNYLISGIGPGPGGVGSLMKNLAPIARNYDFHVISNFNGPSLRKLVSQKKFFETACVFLKRLVAWLWFNILIFFIKNSNVIFLHPQTVGYKSLFRLIKRNKVFLYVMDNSFFCIRSYNYRESKNQECLDCLGCLSNVADECSPFPIPIAKKTNLRYLRELNEKSLEIVFLCQNKNQEELLRLHFGQKVRVFVLGMDTGEVSLSDAQARLLKKKVEYQNPFILFHGAAAGPKGINYVLELAKVMPDLKFVIPASIDDVKGKEIPRNIEFRNITWDTGLKELTENASIVLNPSMWSAPIEGALIKSLAYNPNVAVIKTKYGFEKEIPEDIGLIRLSTDPFEASSTLRKTLLNGGCTTLQIKNRIAWFDKLERSSGFEGFLRNMI
ncbi:hypothetical protein [Halomonas sp. LBP4]|uniref:hypothetical protein n=1 Tax=Halomonas sp. LBP4 TaxID=2044917 RepID=UPI0011B63D51|nr:hypothetical protein [Halomonas sp. LBP4]